MRNLILISCLLLSFSILAKDMTVEGISRVDPADEAQKALSVDLAVVDAIDRYFKKQEPDFRPTYEQYVTRDQLMERWQELVDDYQIKQQAKEDGDWVTVIRMKFDPAMLKNRLSKFATVKRVDLESRSAFAVVFVGREATNKGFIPVSLSAEVEAEVNRIFTDKGFNVLSTYQFNAMTGGVFDKQRLSDLYVQTGTTDWRQVEVATAMSNTRADKFFIVVGSFELHPEEYNKFLKMEVYSATIRGSVINPVGYQTVTTSQKPGHGEDTSKQKAKQYAVQQAARQLAESLTDNLNSQHIY